MPDKPKSQTAPKPRMSPAKKQAVPVPDARRAQSTSNARSSQPEFAAAPRFPQLADAQDSGSRKKRRAIRQRRRALRRQTREAQAMSCQPKLNAAVCNGTTGCSLKSNRVTTRKSPPLPRIAHATYVSVTALQERRNPGSSIWRRSAPPG
jgi:hypothetical protein